MGKKLSARAEQTLREVVAMHSAVDLLRIRVCGVKTVEEIKHWLSESGMCLSDTQNPVLILPTVELLTRAIAQVLALEKRLAAQVGIDGKVDGEVDGEVVDA